MIVKIKSVLMETKINTFKMIGKILFIVLLLGATLFFINMYRQVVPIKYFLMFFIFLSIFVITSVIVHKILKEKIKDRYNLLKILDLFWFILLGFLLYLFAVYIYPG